MQKYWQEELIGSNGPLSGERIKAFNAVSGGCIHQSWELVLDDGRQIFAKITTPEKFPLLKFEATGLHALKSFASEDLLVIPSPMSAVKLNHSSVLLLPWLDMQGGSQKDLGHGLAMLHKSSTNKNPKKFGWEIDGYIGSGPQPGGWVKSWGECFVTLRLIPQIKIASKWGLKIAQIKNLFPKLISYLNGHDPLPSLIHGDLWSGNASSQKDGKGILFDPAIYWADREVDIAMTKLFGGFSKEFYIEYENVWPLPKSSVHREKIYNLYHLLNHANIFGGSYKNQCLTSLKELENMIN